MTPDERERMNVLCIAIQEEKNYEQFAAMLREMSEIIARKEERRFAGHPKLVWNRTRPSRTLPAVVSKVLTSPFSPEAERVEIAIGCAEELFREIRIDNELTDINGHPVALKDGARVDVTFEANLSDTVAREEVTHAHVTHRPKPAA